MNRINIGSADYNFDDDSPEGFRAGKLRMGPTLGAATTGASAYELPPGQAICPYHYEYGEEEWLVVLSGHPTLRHPEGSDTLEPLDVVHFPEGPTGAHLVRNDTDETVRVLMLRTATCLPWRSTPIAARSASGPATTTTTSSRAGRSTSTTGMVRALRPDERRPKGR